MLPDEKYNFLHRVLSMRTEILSSRANGTTFQTQHRFTEVQMFKKFKVTKGNRIEFL
jgi:hypothetical protein